MWVSTWSTPLRWKTTILPVKDLIILLYVIQITTSQNWRPLLGMSEKIFAYVRRAIEIICRIYWIQRGGGHSERRHKFLDHKIPTKYHTWSSKPFTDNFNYSGMKVSCRSSWVSIRKVIVIDEETRILWIEAHILQISVTFFEMEAMMRLQKIIKTCQGLQEWLCIILNSYLSLIPSMWLEFTWSCDFRDLLIGNIRCLHYFNIEIGFNN